MRRIRFLGASLALCLVALTAYSTAGLTHELELSSAAFNGKAFIGGAEVVHAGNDPVEYFHVEVYEGSFRLEGMRGRPTEGKLANAFAVLAGWTNHGDGTCSHWQETWEAQTDFWTDNVPGRSVTFPDPYSGSLDVTFAMHGLRHMWMGLQYMPSESTCSWEERDADETMHLGKATLGIEAMWESMITSTGKGKKNKGQEVTTTVSFTVARFDRASLEIIESDDPPSPFAFSGPARYEVSITNYVDNH